MHTGIVHKQDERYATSRWYVATSAVCTSITVLSNSGIIKNNPECGRGQENRKQNTFNTGNIFIDQFIINVISDQWRRDI
jgi:hypothetical protein